MSNRSGVSHRHFLTGLALAGASLGALPATAAARFGDETLRRGDSGRDVRVLQRKLTKAGYRTRVDGRFGRSTVKRVRAFEGNEELRVDGVVTPADARRLLQIATQGEIGASQYVGGGTVPGAPRAKQTAPGAKARLDDDGFAIAPADAPPEVKLAIAAGNQIAKKPYVYGGGHGRLKARGYDCSGSISYALRKAGLFKASMPSGPMMRFGLPGRGTWITLYANPGHAYMVIAGLRFDTSAHKRNGTRWSAKMRSARSFRARHIDGF